MRIDANGRSQVCCAYTGDHVAHDGVPVSTDRQSLMQIWNADTRREVRRDMVAGRRIAGCEVCYRVEASGGASMRTTDNTAWEQGWLNQQRVTFDAMMAQAASHDFRLPKLPAKIEVEVGNLCNFRCRTCNSFSSSRIARDPVQRKWDGFYYPPHEVPDVEINPGEIRRVRAIENLVDELAADAGSEVRQICFFGGEPFLVREIPRLLERLIAVGRAPQLSLMFISNGSVVPQWLSLATQFRRVDLAVSVDGYANDFEYIRFPGRWSKLTRNLQLFKQLPNVNFQTTTTIQVNNLLGLTRLFRYLDSVEIDFAGYLLHYPPHLAVGILPASIRHRAAARLVEYANADCRPQHHALILSFAAQIEAGAEAGDPGMLRDFMLFTNDLDRSRGQSIGRTDPELVALLEHAGFPWLHETLHAPADGAMAATLAPTQPDNAQAYDANITLHRELGATAKTLRDELERIGYEIQTEEDRARIYGEAARIRDAEARLREDAARVRDEQAARVGLELPRVRRAVDKACLVLEENRRALDQARASRSWRITRPLRAARRVLRQWLQPGSSPGQTDAT
jgi:MoaA/NifB/PqqE/SkfB family radical SAM enzyme